MGTQNTEKDEAMILSFANERILPDVEFVKEKVSGMTSWKNRKLYALVQSMDRGDTLLVSELSSLGRSLTEVLTLLNIFEEKHIQVFSVKENFQLNGEYLASKIMKGMLILFAKIEKDISNIQTKEEL